MINVDQARLPQEGPVFDWTAVALSCLKSPTHRTDITWIGKYERYSHLPLIYDRRGQAQPDARSNHSQTELCCCNEGPDLLSGDEKE